MDKIQHAATFKCIVNISNRLFYVLKMYPKSIRVHNLLILTKRRNYPKFV